MKTERVNSLLAEIVSSQGFINIDQNDVEDYLYCNTRFERASRSRYKYGNLFRGEDGNVYIRLNLQIRFKK